MTKIQQYVDQVKELTGSSTFCVLPWIHIATRPNGDARLCCSTNASGAQTGDYVVGIVKKDGGDAANFEHDTPLEVLNNRYMRNVRKIMLEGNIPASCTKCFEEEQNGVVSKRLWEMYEWNNQGLDFKKLIEDTTIDGTIPPVIRYLDLRLGHTCNLKCVMCTPHDSSSWIKENSELVKLTTSPVVIEQIKWKKFNNEWYEKEEFWKEIFDQIPNITQLYFAGGEPLMIKEHRKFLDEIIRRGYANKISLRYNSNVLFVNEEIINVWTNFKQVKYACSIDATFDRNYFIRFPTKWNEIEDRLQLLDNSPDNIHCSIACTVQALNLKHIIDFVKWKLKQNYKKINKLKVNNFESGGGLINLHLLYIPTFLSARILPKEDKLEFRNQLEDFKTWLWENYTQDDNFWKHNPYGWTRWQAILDFVEAEDHSHLIPDFKEYISNIERLRNLDFKAIFPELAHLW